MQCDIDSPPRRMEKTGLMSKGKCQRDNRAVEDGLSKQMNPFRHMYTGVDKTSKRAIELDEIRRIKNLNLSNTPKLDFARDIFLFSFYMRGMSFIDIAYLQKTNLPDCYI